MCRASGLHPSRHRMGLCAFSMIIFTAVWSIGAAKATQLLVTEEGSYACTLQVALLEIVAPCAAAFCLVLCSTPKILISEARSKYNRMALECYKASLPFLAATRAWMVNLSRVAQKAWLPTLWLLLLVAIFAACKATWCIVAIFWNFGARRPDQNRQAEQELCYADAKVPTALLAPIKVHPGSRDHLSPSATDLKQASAQSSSSTPSCDVDPDTPPRLSEAGPGSASPFAAERSSLSDEDKATAAAAAPGSNGDSCSLVLAGMEEHVRQLSVHCMWQTALLHVIKEEKQQLEAKLQAAEAALATLHSSSSSSNSSSSTTSAAAAVVANTPSFATPAPAAVAAVANTASSATPAAAEAAVASTASSTPPAAAEAAVANTASSASPPAAAVVKPASPAPISVAAAAVVKAVTFALPPPAASATSGVAQSAATHHQLDPVVSRDVVNVCSSRQRPIGSCSSVALHQLGAVEPHSAPAGQAALQLQGVFVGGLGSDIGEDVLVKLFVGCGNLRAAWICRQRGSRASLGYGYVVFQGPAAGAAVQRAVKINGQLVQLQPITVKQTQRDFTALLAAR